MAQLIDLGKLRFDWKGLYDNDTVYELNDVVRYDSNAYVYISAAADSGNIPTDNTRWGLLVEGTFPDQAGKPSAILTTNGTSVSWTHDPTVDSLTVVKNLVLQGSVTTTLRTVDVTYTAIATNVATVTTATDHGFLVGESVTLAGVGMNFNGTKTIVGVPTDTTFTFAISATDMAETAAEGTATVYANISTQGTLTVGRSASIGGDLAVTGATTLTGNLTHQGDSLVEGDATFSADVIVKGDFSVTTHDHAVIYKRVLDNVATLTLQVSDGRIHRYDVGDKINVAGVGAPFDGHYQTITAITDDTVSFAVTYANMPNQAATGTVSVEGHVSFSNELTVGEGATFGATVNVAGDFVSEGIVHLGNAAEEFDVAAGLTNPALVIEANGGPYAQVAFHNSDSTASADIIVYNDNGDDSSGWMDMGTTGSAFTQAEFGLTGPNEGYIFYEAPEGTTGTGNLVFATGDKGTQNRIVFGAGGFASGNSQVHIIPDETFHIEIPTPSTSASTGALTVNGGVGIAGDMNIQGDVAIEGTITFGGSGTTVETANLNVTDPAVFVGTNNQADIVDLAFYGEYATTVSPIVATISNKALTDNVATITTAADHTFRAGDVVVITDVNATFNGTYNIIAVPTTTTFTYAKTNTNVVSGAATGTATVSARRQFSGIARDATDGIVKVFKDATTKPTTTVNFSEVGLSYADMQFGNAIATGQVTAQGGLVVSSGQASTLGGALTVGGITTFNGVVTTSQNVTISGRLDVQEIREDVIDSAIVANVFTADYSSGNIFYLTASPTANFTVNLTNAPTDNGKSITLTIVVPQGAAGYIPSAFQIAGTGQTLRWANGAAPTPTSSSGKIDMFNFTLIRRASAWTVLGASNLNY